MNSYDIRYRPANIEEEPLKFGDDPLCVVVFEMDLFPSTKDRHGNRKPSLFMDKPEDILRKRVGCSDASLIALTKLRSIANNHPELTIRLVVSSRDMINPRIEKMVSDAMYCIGHEADTIGINYYFWHKELKVVMALPYPKTEG